MPTAAIAIGSNLGDRHAHIQLTRTELAQLPASTITAFSSIHETEPVGPSGQGPYLNAAALLDTQLDPHALLNHLLEIERKAGRVRREKWGPRTLDLDLLLYDQLILNTPTLTLPHPHMHERMFVLAPLNEIAADRIHPTSNKTIEQLHNAATS